jgi:hypothetical protein
VQRRRDAAWNVVSCLPRLEVEPHLPNALFEVGGVGCGDRAPPLQRAGRGALAQAVEQGLVRVQAEAAEEPAGERRDDHDGGVSPSSDLVGRAIVLGATRRDLAPPLLVDHTADEFAVIEVRG